MDKLFITIGVSMMLIAVFVTTDVFYYCLLGFGGAVILTITLATREANIALDKDIKDLQTDVNPFSEYGKTKPVRPSQYGIPKIQPTYLSKGKGKEKLLGCLRFVFILAGTLAMVIIIWQIFINLFP